MDFLRIELDLIVTMIQMAKTTHQPETRQRLLDNSMEAVRTIRKFEIRISKTPDREQIRSRVNELEDNIRAEARGKSS